MSDTMMMISYIPLFYGANSVFDINDEICRMLLNTIDITNVEIKACGWLSNGNTMQPVFIADKAKEIYDHMIWWSDGSPNEWFSLVVSKTNYGYHALLVPNMIKSKERTLKHHGLNNNVKIEFIFKPLKIQVQGFETIDKILPIFNNLEFTTIHFSSNISTEPEFSIENIKIERNIDIQEKMDSSLN